MKDSTEIITERDESSANIMTWKQLTVLDFSFNQPFSIPLFNNQFLHAEQVIRILPKKRIVVFGTWMNKPVFAKLFFDLHHSKRHMEKEVAGIHILRQNKIPTPALYYQGISADKRIYVVLFQHIFESKNLETIWKEKTSAESLLSLFKYMMLELATQHVLGVVQQDLHLKNFLITKKRIYTLDGGQIEQHQQLLSKKISMNNLALFLSQLGVGVTGFQEKLFKHYAKVRGWLLKPQDFTDLAELIQQHNKYRWRHYERKIFRDSSEFVCHEDLNTFIMYDRDEAKPELITLLADPDKIFKNAASIILKSSTKATLNKIHIHDREYVIKRYNCNNIWQIIFSIFRKSKARYGWRLSQKLKLFGIEVPKPVAFIEHRFFGFKTVCYFICEYVSGINIADYLNHIQNDTEKTSAMIKQISQLINNLAKLDVSHIDLKTETLLVNKHAKPVLIGVDKTYEHSSFTQLRSAWQKDIEKILNEFSNNEVIKSKLIEEFEQNNLSFISTKYIRSTKEMGE